MAGEYYESSIQHILAELERIDLLIQIQVWRARQVQSADREFQGLYISEEELAELLAKPLGLPRWAAVPTPPSLPELATVRQELEAAIARRKRESRERGIPLRLAALAHHLQLTPLDLDILLIALAPELDLGYERLYSYLQDDVTKKRPSVDLALNLLCPSFPAKLAARQRFVPPAPLLANHLLVLFQEPSQQHPPLLGKYLKVDEGIVNYLLEVEELDARLLPQAQYLRPAAQLEELCLPSELKQRLIRLIKLKKARLIFYFQGSYGLGKQTTAEALCRQLGKELLVVEGEKLLSLAATAGEQIIELACREALLRGAALYWQGFDALLAEERSSWLALLLQQLENHPLLVFLAGETPWEPKDALHDLSYWQVQFPQPTAAERVQIWQSFLPGQQAGTAGVELEALASKFRLSGGQIRDAAATARNLARWREPEQEQLTTADLYTACRWQSNRKLSRLASKIVPHYRWDDIVLPAEQRQQLREICNSVKYRALIYSEWGFEDKLALGKGLNVFFAGPPGTGKTMAADIIAGELGLDLYKIDLSAIVSKYIGETEKNLSRIFREAETSNAILFFDEADALFGKRSEVRDSHDRYANIEISYLLQRMEEYEGVVILATNLRKNVDEAFVRRMHFSVDFPFPSKKERRRIWEQIWPEATPRSPDLDLDLMAHRFEIAGGNIRNIALAAAFLAADGGGAVTMAHLKQATRREYQKMGKILAET